jgi:hypothetical protein
MKALRVLKCILIHLIFLNVTSTTCFRVEVFRVLRFFHNLLIVTYIAITPCFLLSFLQISNIDFFLSKYVFDFSFMPLMVDHVIGVAIASGCDKLITCTSLGKSTNTTLNASTSNTFGASNSRSIGVRFLMCLSLQLL